MRPSFFRLPSFTNRAKEDTDDVTVTQNPRVLQWGGSLQYNMPYLVRRSRQTTFVHMVLAGSDAGVQRLKAPSRA